MKYAKFCRILRQYGEVDKTWIRDNGHEKEVQNHTVPIALRSLKPIYKPCELNCGLDVSNQHLEYRRTESLEIRWLVKCVNCGLYQDPKTLDMVDHRNLNKFFMKKTP